MRLLAFNRLFPEKGIGYSKVHLGRLEKVGSFPKRVRLGPKGRVAWIEAEIDEWIEARAAERDNEGQR